MLPQKLARDLLPLVNHESNFDLLVEYADNRIEQLVIQLLSTDSINHVKFLQGQISELKTIKQLREHVKADSK